MLVDTHCHIHDAQYPLDADEVLGRAQSEGVDKMICVGTDAESSRRALAFAATRDNVFAAVGVHPHDASSRLHSDFADPKATAAQEIISLTREFLGAKGGSQKSRMQKGDTMTVVAIGEIGLDYFYLYSPRDVQIQALRAQIDLALAYDLPIIFHVRDAFDDFWPIFDSYGGKIRGVLHSFTDSMANMQAGIDRGLYIGVNGISTFTKDQAQKVTFAAIPLDKLLLETDAPFLTPMPLRGKVNEPAFVKHVAEHHATIRGLTLDEVTEATTTNAHALFAL